MVFQREYTVFSKRRGRSRMVSGFLFEHPSGPFFELSEDKWKQAVAKYKTLTVDDDVDDLSRTVTVSINIGTDAYFDNDTILSQFERLFQMLEFKQAYKGHRIEIIVDNARIHTTKMYSLQDFRKDIGAQCTNEKIEYVDENGVRQVIDCYFKQDAQKGKSKGLVEVCKDLGVKLPDKVKLSEIYEKFENIELFRT